MLTNSPISFRHDRQKRAAHKRWIGYLVVFLMMLLVLRTPLSDMLGSFFGVVARPLWVAENSFSETFRDTAQLFSSKESLVDENRRLEEALDLVVLEGYSRELLREENARLKAALGRAEERELLLARVLATPGRSPFDTLVIDVGTDHEIVSGMKVAVDGDFVIGEVGRVTGKSAVVKLYSSYGNELAVNVGTSSIPAVAHGEGGGNFRITLPRGITVSPGDLVAIPAFFPRYMGVVEAVEGRVGGSLQDLYLRWPFNMNELTWVYVLTAETSKNEE